MVEFQLRWENVIINQAAMGQRNDIKSVTCKWVDRIE